MSGFSEGSSLWGAISFTLVDNLPDSYKPPLNSCSDIWHKTQLSLGLAKQQFILVIEAGLKLYSFGVVQWMSLFWVDNVKSMGQICCAAGEHSRKENLSLEWGTFVILTL